MNASLTGLDLSHSKNEGTNFGFALTGGAFVARLEVVLFANSVTESVQSLYRFQRVNCLLKLMLQSVHVHYKKVVDAFLILLVLKFHNHRPDSLRIMNFTNWLLCSVH